MKCPVRSDGLGPDAGMRLGGCQAHKPRRPNPCFARHAKACDGAVGSLRSSCRCWKADIERPDAAPSGPAVIVCGTARPQARTIAAGIGGSTKTRSRRLAGEL